MAPIVCPIDNKDDAIQKVSAIVNVETSSGDLSSMTELARLLAAPAEPIQPRSILGGAWLVAAVISYSCLCFLLSLPIVSILRPSENSKLITPLNFILTFAGVILMIFLTYQRENSKLRRQEPKYAKEKQEWDAAKKRWDRLYYCHKHGIVFDPHPEPGMDETCEPTNFKDFLY